MIINETVGGEQMKAPTRNSAILNGNFKARNGKGKERSA